MNLERIVPGWNSVSESPTSGRTGDAEAGAAEVLGLPLPTAESKPAGTERRTETRHLFRTHVQLFLPDKRVVEAKSFDLSSSGIGLVSDFNLTPETIVTVSFTLPFSNTPHFLARISAKIAYCVLSYEYGGFKIGLLFLQPGADLKSAVQRYFQS